MNARTQAAVLVPQGRVQGRQAGGHGGVIAQGGASYHGEADLVAVAVEAGRALDRPEMRINRSDGHVTGGGHHQISLA
jgi:hypothetical protein